MELFVFKLYQLFQKDQSVAMVVQTLDFFRALYYILILKEILSLKINSKRPFRILLLITIHAVLTIQLDAFLVNLLLPICWSRCCYMSRKCPEQHNVISSNNKQDILAITVSKFIILFLYQHCLGDMKNIIYNEI